MTPTSPAPLTIGRLARAVGLARASLLHYESLGLLQPLARSEAGYRLYAAAEVERVRTIGRYRDAGLSLSAIASLLQAGDAPASRASAASLIEQRLLALCAEVERLRLQQQDLARLLALPEFRGGLPIGSKAAWVALLQRAGFSADDMRRWHAGFEAANPVQHGAFLRSLGLSAVEIRSIRRAAAVQPARRSAARRNHMGGSSR